MSKKKETGKELTLDEFLKMSEEQQQELPSEQYVRLINEKAAREQHQTDVREKDQIKKKYYKELGGKEPILLQIEDKRAWLKPMDRKLLSMVAATAGEDPVAQTELVLENCWLEGDTVIRDDDDYFIPAMDHLKGMMTKKVGRLVKF